MLNKSFILIPVALEINYDTQGRVVNELNERALAGPYKDCGSYLFFLKNDNVFP